MDDLTKIRTVIRWSNSSDAPEDFNTDFVSSLEENYDKWGRLTMKQSAALDNIIDRFEIDTEAYR